MLTCYKKPDVKTSESFYGSLPSVLSNSLVDIFLRSKIKNLLVLNTGGPMNPDWPSEFGPPANENPASCSALSSLPYYKKKPKEEKWTQEKQWDDLD